MRSDPALDRAEKYFEEERRVLLSGRLGELSALAETRDTALAGLADETVDEARLKHLRAIAARNRELLAAAAEGVERATRRLGDLRKAAGPIGSYSASGGRCEIGSIHPKLERKA